jgi:hypothetical protein
MRLFLAVVAIGALSGSCKYGVADISGVPDNPTYNRDIYPLYRDHCLVCHGSPPDRGAPSYFRLDVYDDILNADQTVKTSGAKSLASTCAYDVKIGKMPPGAKSGDGVGPNGYEMLQKWADTQPEPPQ